MRRSKENRALIVKCSILAAMLLVIVLSKLLFRCINKFFILIKITTC